MQSLAESEEVLPCAATVHCLPASAGFQGLGIQEAEGLHWRWILSCGSASIRKESRCTLPDWGKQGGTRQSYSLSCFSSVRAAYREHKTLRNWQPGFWKCAKRECLLVERLEIWNSAREQNKTLVFQNSLGEKIIRVLNIKKFCSYRDIHFNFFLLVPEWKRWNPHVFTKFWFQQVCIFK